MKNKLILIKKNLSRYLALLVVLISSCAFAQVSEVTGVVTGSEDGIPLPGVSIIIQGTTVGAVTDFDGNYSISANEGDVLFLSYIGKRSVTVIVTGAKHDVSMEDDVEELDAVVVVGYGTVKKIEVTGAVTRVDSDDIAPFITSDVASRLQGQIAGVSVSSSSGEPGEAANIQIRGITSLAGSNTPLYVVNGIPQIGDPGLAPNEIETIDVLKDAASTAVYGSRGAAGVILITTKSGKDGVLKVDFDYNYGIQVLGQGSPLMNTEDQVFYELATGINAGINAPINNNPEWIINDTDFDTYVFNQQAEVKTYNLSVSGGTDQISYSAVGGLFDQDGSLVNSNFKRYNGRISTTYKKGNWKIDGSIATTNDDRQRASNGLIQSAIRFKPYYPPLDVDGGVASSNGVGGVTTPVTNLIRALGQIDNSNRDRTNINLGIKVSLSNDLDFITNAGSSITNDVRNIFRPDFLIYNVNDDTTESDPTKSGISAISTRTTKFSWDAGLSYNKQLGDHKIGFQAVVTLEEDNNETFSASIEGVGDNNITVLDGGTINKNVSSGFNYRTKRVGTLGRLQYNYKSKYIISALVRYDGSSRFGKEYRWGAFPSIAAAWNVSMEPFWKPLKRTINKFKIRLSRGEVGNDNFDDYGFESVVAPFADYIFDVNDESVDFGSAVRAYANADVKWETSVSNNIGVDLSFFKNKFSLSVDYYNTQKEDMLFPVTLPGSAGAYDESEVTFNIGNMRNSGLEVSANYKMSIGKSEFRFGGTFTDNNNEITKVASDNIIYNSQSNIQGQPITAIAKGYEAGAFFVFETNGVIKNQEQLDAYRLFPSREDAEFGDLIYVDTNGDGILSSEDRTYQGSGLPDFEFGFNFTWELNGFDFSMNWFGTIGSEIYNANKNIAYGFQRHQDLVGQWTAENPTSNTPSFRGRGVDHPNYAPATDYWIENGDYLRLKQITLGYTIPKYTTNKLGLNTLRFYLTAQNPITITNYEGFDPEIGGNNVATRGIDSSRYPISSIYSLGLKVSF